MRKCLFLVSVLLFATACLAAEFSASLSIKTGDASLDLALSNINKQAATLGGPAEIKAELRQTWMLSDKEIVFLSKRGYTLAEIYYMAILAKKTGKNISDIMALHSKGVGWGVLAKRLGVRPSDLNKLRVEMKKQKKAVVKEKAQLKIHVPAGGVKEKGKKK